MKILDLFKKKDPLDKLLRALTDIKIRNILRRNVAYDSSKSIVENVRLVYENLDSGYDYQLNQTRKWQDNHTNLQKCKWHSWDKLKKVYQENRKKWDVRHTEMQKLKTKVSKLEKEIERLKNEKSPSN